MAVSYAQLARKIVWRRLKGPSNCGRMAKRCPGAASSRPRRRP